MGLSSIFVFNNDNPNSKANQDAGKKVLVTFHHEIDLEEFFYGFENLCIYNPLSSHKKVVITEYAPQIFKEIRLSKGINSLYFFKSFIPLFNFQAIHNFFTGSGKSSSLFFFTDNKAFVIKTLKEEEWDLLMKENVLQNYYTYMMSNKESLLSKYYGIFTLTIPFMEPLHLIIMDNVVG